MAPQEAQTGGWASFQRAADTAAIAGLPLGGFGWCFATEMDDFFFHSAILNQAPEICSYDCRQAKETSMKKFVSVLVAALFAVGSVSAIACGDKAKDEKQMSTPAKPKV